MFQRICQTNLFIKDNCSICSCVWFSEKEPACNAGATGDLDSNPWVGKIPWRRAWQPTPVFLHGESHGQRSLAGYSPSGCKESDTTEATEHAHFLFLPGSVLGDCTFLGICPLQPITTPNLHCPNVDTHHRAGGAHVGSWCASWCGLWQSQVC